MHVVVGLLELLNSLLWQVGHHVSLIGSQRFAIDGLSDVAMGIRRETVVGPSNCQNASILPCSNVWVGVIQSELSVHFETGSHFGVFR